MNGIIRSQRQSNSGTNLASVRRLKEHGRTFRTTLAKLAQLTRALAAAVEALEFVDLPELDDETDFYAEVRRFEISLIERALKRVSGSQVRAARLLNMNVTTLNSKIKSYDINSPARTVNRTQSELITAPKVAARSLR